MNGLFLSATLIKCWCRGVCKWAGRPENPSNCSKGFHSWSPYTRREEYHSGTWHAAQKACLWWRGFQSRVQVTLGSLIPLALDQSRPPMPKQADIRSLCQAWPSCTAPAPAGPEEPTDLISCLSNCHTVWHVADLDVCVFVHVWVCACVVFSRTLVYVTEGVTAAGTDGQ